ncbi:MAG: hypothetical protein LBR00_00070 [Clostridiales Family XIII bacterium]|jgi:hypothetical protein|nr:hypothetical protein [Clostridiales Family XIII bacterium]
MENGTMEKTAAEKRFWIAQIDYELLTRRAFRISGGQMLKTTAVDAGTALKDARGKLASLRAEDFRRATKQVGADILTAAGKAKTEAVKPNVFRKAGNAVNRTASKAREAIQSTPATVKAAVASVKEMDGDDWRNTVASAGKHAVKAGKTVSGVQAMHDRLEAKNIKDVCAEYYAAAEVVTQEHKEKLNGEIQSFGESRLESLHETLARFLDYLEILQQKNKIKEYEIFDGIEVSAEKLVEMRAIDMDVQKALKMSATSGVLGVAAVLGTPALVTTTVSAVGVASTGTAIGSLTGAAANSAVLAWLGGGSVAAGGGGMAAGATVLAAATVGATAAVAILAVGIMTSMHYGNVLTQAREYEKETGIAVANHEKAWIVMDGIASRVQELRQTTQELRSRTEIQLDRLEALLAPEVVFDSNNPDHVKVFNRCGLLVKTMTELAQTPLLNDEGSMTAESYSISGKIRKILNTEV